MKKGLRKVLVLVMAGVMTIAPAMTASAFIGGGDGASNEVYDYQTPARNRMRSLFPSITDAHLDMIFGDDGWGEIELDGYWEYWNANGGWANFSTVAKESWAYLCALSQEDREWLRNNWYESIADCDRNWCVNGGADAADLDATIARLTGQAASATATSSPSWKQDAKGWWVENPNGTYLTNQWFESNGKWYYMGADGYMLINTTTPDGYTVNADGVWVQ